MLSQILVLKRHSEQSENAHFSTLHNEDLLVPALFKTEAIKLIKRKCSAC